MDLRLIYQTLTTHKVALEDLGQILRRIYANGYMDSTEEQELELLTHTSSFVEVPKQVKESIQKLLSHHIYLISQYRRFEKNLPVSLQGKNLKSPVESSIKAQLISLAPLPEDGYRLTLQLTKERGQPISISMELPNKKGFYTNGTKAGQEDPFLLEIQKSLAWQVLQEQKLPEEEKRVVLEAVGRMGNPPL